MAKVTSKLQVTIPKRVAKALGIVPGDEIAFEPSGNGLRVLLPGRTDGTADSLALAERLALFDRATARQSARDRGTRRRRQPSDRGWTRDALYGRGRAR